MKLYLFLFFLLAIVFAQDDDPAAAPEDPAVEDDPAAEDAEEEESGANVQEFELKDSKDLMKTIQGINEDTVWVIQFHDNDPEDELLDGVKACLGSDQMQDDSYQELDYQLTAIDINNHKFDDAMDALGMTSNQF